MEQRESDIINNIRIEYISDPKTSYRKLAEKYNYPLKKISKLGKQENWKQLRVQLGDKILKKTINRISTEKSNELARVIESSSKLLSHINRALERDDEFDMVYVTKQGKMINLNKADAKAINNMASALKQLMTIMKIAESDDDGPEGLSIKIEGDFGEKEE